MREHRVCRILILQVPKVVTSSSLDVLDRLQMSIRDSCRGQSAKRQKLAGLTRRNETTLTHMNPYMYTIHLERELEVGGTRTRSLTNDRNVWHGSQECG